MSAILPNGEIKPRRPDCLADETVNGEPVSTVDFPINRENTGNIRKYRPETASHVAAFSRKIMSLAGEFPARRNREFALADQGKFGADQGSVQEFQRICCDPAFIGAKVQTAASQTPRNGACRRGSDVVVFGPGEIKGEQRGRMASTLAQRLNDQGVTAGQHQPVARVGFLVGGQPGLVDRRREFGRCPG